MKKTYPDLYKLAEQIKGELKPLGSSGTDSKPSGLMTKGSRNG